ncbi:MAG: hypothetical protein V1887_02760 [Candidatus Aenigmatarchaeota archaeon]
MHCFGKDELRTFLERSLSEREKDIFLRTAALQGNSVTSVSRLLSGYPQSTAKLILRRLRGKGLIIYAEGLPLRCTPLGRKVAGILGAA